MESDPPLIEISVEDETSISASTLFSPIARLKDKGDTAKCKTPGCGNGNKENINVNKSELTKLSVEPQQMKRRKKGGAYNLRKSLAWDKAFSTDEGFLDPLELSMLGGSNVNSCRELLPSISEDGGKFSGNSYRKGNSSDLQGTPKIMSNQKGSGSGSKSCCPRPLVFSSLKRAANTSILKAAAKESKLPKLPVSASGTHPLHRSNKSNLPSTSQSCQKKINQIEADIQKVPRSQSTSNITMTPSIKRKSGSDSVSAMEKSPIQQSQRNKDISAGKLFSSSHLQPRLSSHATRSTSGHKAPCAALPRSGLYTADSHEVVRTDRVLTEKVSGAATMPQVQSRKPSGLRMPSPSLGFFSQPISSNSFIQKATQQIKSTRSNVPNLQKFNVLNCTYNSRLPHVPGKLLQKVENNSSSGSAKVSGFRSECISSSDYDKTHESGNAKLAKKSVLVKELKISLHAKSAEVTEEKQAAQRTPNCDIEVQESDFFCKVVQSSFVQHMDLQKNDNHWLIVDESSDQLNKDGNRVVVDSSAIGSNNVHVENSNLVSQISCHVIDQDGNETTDTVYHQHIKDNKSSSLTVVHGTISESQTEGSAGDFGQDSVLMTHNDESKSTLEFDPWKTEKAKSPNAFSGEDDEFIMMTLPVRNDSILLEDKSSKPPINRSEDFANVNTKLCESRRSEILCSNVPPHTSAAQANQDNSVFDQMHDEYSVADDSDGLLLFKSAAAEKCERIHGLETCLSVCPEVNHSETVTKKHGVNEDDDAVMSNSFEKPQVDECLSNAKEMIISLQDDHCFIDSQARPDRSLETSKDHTELFYVRKKENVGANDMENQKQPEVAEIEAFSEKGFLENEKNLVEDSKILHQYHSVESARTIYHSSRDPVISGSCQIPCLLVSTMEVDKSEKDNATNVLDIGDTEVQTFNERNSKLFNPIVDNLVSAVLTDTNVESGQPPELHLPSLVADHFCYEKHDSPLNDCTLVSEGTSGEGREGNCVPTAFTVQEQPDINQVHLSMNGSSVLMEGVNEKQSRNYELSGSVGTETLNEHDIDSLDTVFKSDVVLSGQSTYEESCVASIARGAQTFGSISTYEQSHSSEISGFIDQKIRVSTEIVNAVDTGVNKMNSTSPADIDLNVTQKTESLVTDYQQGRANTSKRSGDGGMIDNLTIKLPVHAIPFSDEWLAAMEAAGEEILTMKRGAVQNSPTEKASPKPSPWSPVKKKQNQIGPYDCTKFINVPHSSD